MFQRLFTLLIVSVGFNVLAADAAAERTEARRPNVVLILIDDLNHYGVTAYGANRLSEWTGLFTNTTFSTPRIDALAREGLRCDNAFVYPLCEATRIALMSGQLNSRNFLQPKAQHASDITFGDVFQRAGYKTGIFGKWKQTRGTPEVPAKDYIYEFGWDEFGCFDVVDERQRFINPYLVVNGERRNYAGRTDVDPETGRRWYGPDLCNRMALDFIDRHHEEPFFLYYPMMLVHDEHKPTPDTEPHSLFDNFDEATHNRDGHTGDDRSYFPDMLAYTDKLVGKIIDKLEERGLRENTLVVVMGDNGTKEPFIHVLPDGSTYAGGKGGTKDNGLHVPLILSWPGTIPSGEGDQIRAYDGLVDVVDIHPTLCEAAGVPIPNAATIDGISFWPQATGAPGEARDVIYTWYNANNKSTNLAKLVRYAFDKEFKRYAPHGTFPEGRFFDLRTDPLELAGDREVKVQWVHTHRSGLELGELDDEQRAAHARLGKVLDEHRHVPVSGLEISKAGKSVKVGESMDLTCRVSPPEATRRKVVWESSDPSVASVDKFGVLTARKPGRVEVAVYSWDDARPLATGKSPSYRRDGISDRATVEVLP